MSASEVTVWDRAIEVVLVDYRAEEDDEVRYGLRKALDALQFARDAADVRRQLAEAPKPTAMPATRTTPWLQIYGQGAWHDPACIVGDHSGLTALRDIIAGALDGPESHGVVFAYDGEGYDLFVLIRSYENAPEECHYHDVASMGGGEWDMPKSVWKSLKARQLAAKAER